MQRLAQMQGSSIDMLSLNASASALDQPIPPIQTLPLICQRMGLNARKLAEREFNRDTLADQWVRFLERTQAESLGSGL